MMVILCSAAEGAKRTCHAVVLVCNGLKHTTVDNNRVCGFCVGCCGAAAEVLQKTAGQGRRHDCHPPNMGCSGPAHPTGAARNLGLSVKCRFFPQMLGITWPPTLQRGVHPRPEGWSPCASARACTPAPRTRCTSQEVIDNAADEALAGYGNRYKSRCTPMAAYPSRTTAAAYPWDCTRKKTRRWLNWCSPACTPAASSTSRAEAPMRSPAVCTAWACPSPTRWPPGWKSWSGATAA